MKSDLAATRRGRDARATEAVSRGFGEALLELSAGLEGAVIRREVGTTTVIVAALVARGRRLLRAAYRLIEEDAEPEAAALYRVMEDYLATVRWLLGDPQRRTQVWAADGLRRRLAIVEGATKHDKKLATPELKKECESLRAKYQDAIRTLGEEPSLPSANGTAAAPNPPFAHSVAYSMSMQSAVNACELAVDDMLVRHPKGQAIASKPRFSLVGVSPYLVGAQLMLELLALLAERAPELGLAPGVERLRRSMSALAEPTPVGNGR